MKVSLAVNKSANQVKRVKVGNRNFIKSRPPCLLSEVALRLLETTLRPPDVFQGGEPQLSAAKSNAQHSIKV